MKNPKKIREQPETKLRWSRGALCRVTQCPACESERRSKKTILTYDPRLPFKDDRWEFHRCLECKSLYLDPRPDNKSLKKAYEVYYTHETQPESLPTQGINGLIWKLIHGYLNKRFAISRTPSISKGWHILRLLPPWRMKLDYYGRHLCAQSFPNRGKLLDIGCGNGAFLIRAKEMGWEVIGLDPDPLAVATCRKQGLKVIEGSLDDIPKWFAESFDAITMNHCLEHIQTPKSELEKAYRLLRQGGQIWIACPNPRSIGTRFFGSSWRGLHPPYHLVLPSPSQTKRLLKAAGFNEIESKKRGAHAKFIVNDSVEILKKSSNKSTQIRTVLSLFVRIFSDLMATINSHWGEEFVVIGRRRD